MFRPLGPEDSPVLGMFYVEQESNLSKDRVRLSPDRPLALGMASLVGSNGVAVTCAHVVLVWGAAPGGRIQLFGASDDVCVEVSAEVLSEGWRGPMLDPNGRPLAHEHWTTLWDERPDEFGADLAFLRVLPETARLHLRRKSRLGVEVQDGTARLLQNARVLPFAAPGYQGPGRSLQAYATSWIFGAPDCQPTAATFASADWKSHHALRVRSESIRAGYSGGAVWDPVRRRVIGLVRRGLKAVAPDLVICTDARAFEHCPGVSRLEDDRYSALAAVIAQRTSRLAEFGWERVAGRDGDTVHIEPEVVSMLPQGPSGPLAAVATQPMPAIEGVRTSLMSNRLVVLRGVAGAGKSLLLRRIVSVLLESEARFGERSVLPLLLTASELARRGCSVRECLDAIWAEAGPIAHPGSTASEVLLENGAALIVVIDGLDEIPKGDQHRVLQRLRALARGRGADDAGDSTVTATIVASRPSEVLRLIKPDGSPMAVLDLLAFDETRIRAFVNSVYADPTVANEFGERLRRLRWNAGRVPPLQLAMATRLYEWEGDLPARAVDITSRFVVSLVQRAVREIEDRAQGTFGLKRDIRDLYLPAALDIAGVLAWVSIESNSDRAAASAFVQAVQDWNGAPWCADPPGVAEFVFRELAGSLALMGAVEDDGAEPGIAWAHRTFAEALYARHIVSTLREDGERLSARTHALLNKANQGAALQLLAEADRMPGGEASVARILRDCINSDGATPSDRSNLFVLRALAAGIDAAGATRRQQATLLVRYFVSQIDGRMSCASLFRSDELPEASEIVAYPELRADIFEVMRERFRMRMARATPRHPAMVLAKEAEILEHANLWPDFENLGLVRSSEPTAAQRIQSESGNDRLAIRDGTATIEIRSPSGANALNMPAGMFVQALATTARHTAGDTTTAELVRLAIVLATGQHSTD